MQQQRDVWDLGALSMPEKYKEQIAGTRFAFEGGAQMKKKNNEITIRSSAAEYLTYVAATCDNEQSFEMRYQDENVWLTQKMMVVLYDMDVRTINDHIQTVYKDSELTEEATIRNFWIVQTEGTRQVTRDIRHYSLQMIIAVGFKINNDRAVQFRKWANAVVKDYTIQGWVMDEERLKNGGTILTQEYFEKQLEKIREIRLSERRFYQRAYGSDHLERRTGRQDSSPSTYLTQFVNFNP